MRNTVSNILAGILGINVTTKINTQTPKQSNKVSNKRARSGEMPKYYGFRKRPVLARDKNGFVKIISLKNADKKGLEIVDTMGITKNFN